jgi:hypothetical protein
VGSAGPREKDYSGVSMDKILMGFIFLSIEFIISPTGMSPFNPLQIPVLYTAIPLASGVRFI